MRFVATCAVAIALGACSWSNSLYYARRYSAEAMRLERDNRPFEAATSWGRAAVKADSAYARQPGGSKGAEALWLRGRARARSGDCTSAVPSLEAGLGLAPSAPWRDELQLELGRCLGLVGDPAARRLLEGLQGSADDDVRRAARLAMARTYVASGEWERALVALEGIDSTAALTDRAIALVALGRRDEALRELDPLLASTDTLRAWATVAEAFAASDVVAADQLIARLEATQSATGNRLASLQLAAARGASRHDPLAMSRLLDRVATGPDVGQALQGRLMIAEHLVASAATPHALRRAVDSVTVLAPEDGGSALRFGVLQRLAGGLAAQHDSVAAGARQGDMLTFLHGEAARDSLANPRLAAYFFARLERDWPASPYVGKALIARLALEPDSADALRARLTQLEGNPYVEYLAGREHPMFAELELALMTYAQLRRSRGAVRPRATDDAPAGLDIP